MNEEIEQGIDDIMFDCPDIQPYQFEPLIGDEGDEAASSSSDEEQPDINVDRLGNTDW